MRLMLFLIFTMNAAVFAKAAVHLKFTDLEHYLEISPTGRRVLSQRDIQISSAKASLQWRNPELAAEHEALSNNAANETESTIVLSKSFMSPWSLAAHKTARQFDIEAAELDQQQQQLFLLAEWKYAYVDLKIKHALRQRLHLFQDRIEEVSEISKNRHQQGTTSGLDDALLQMSVFDIKATLLHLDGDIRHQENSLKAQLGFSSDQELVLDSDIEFQPVNLSSIRAGDAPETSPQVQSSEAKMAAAQNRVRFEQGNLLPDFSFTGGYKQINRDFKGGVIGLSIPLPLLSLNRAAVHQAQAELTLASINHDLIKTELIHAIQESSILVKESQILLNDYADMFRTDDVMDNLVFSFKEGWISLTDLFSGIEVYANALESYYTHLLHYYNNIFQLEAMTGLPLVQF